MRWLFLLNITLLVLLACVGILFFICLPTKQEVPLFTPRIEGCELPKVATSLIGDLNLKEGPLALNWVPPQMQLPDLREELQFFGKNSRPDAEHAEISSYHIGLKSSGQFHSFCTGKRIYLVYQGNYPGNFMDKIPYREPISVTQKPLWGDTSAVNKGSYVFSPDNQPTPLWLEIRTQSDAQISLHIHMLDEKGILVKNPEERHQIVLNAQNFPKSQTVGWELGGYRVDSTFLVRQKARWVGQDCFLKMHGGKEFIHAEGRERIDFIEGQTSYSCFVGLHEYLIWKDNRWVSPKSDEKTEGFPILCVKKIDEKIMHLELWNAIGQIKVSLNLIRTKDRKKMPNISQEFKFVGAKTWAQFIVERPNKERLMLKPHDWLVLGPQGWTKLDTPELIDEYVEGQLTGPLFILDKMSKQNGRQVLIGHLFNTFRTEVEEIQLEAASNTSLANFCRTIPQVPPIKPMIKEEEQ